MPDGDFNMLEEVKKRYPALKDWDADRIYRNMADPAKFREAFPEYAHIDNTTIGRNVAREAGKPRDWWNQFVNRVEEGQKPLTDPRTMTEAQAASGIDPRQQRLVENISGAQALASMAPGLSTRGMPEANVAALAHDVGYGAGRAAAATKEGIANIAYTPENKLRLPVRAGADALGATLGGVAGHYAGVPEAGAHARAGRQVARPAPHGAVHRRCQ